jgi:hypothetical protein
MMGLLKSMDRLAKESDFIRSFCGPPGSPSSTLLSKLKWYDGTITPYFYTVSDVNAEANNEAENLTNRQDNDERYLVLQRQRQKHKQKQNRQQGSQPRGNIQSQNKAIKYCEKVIEILAKHSNNRQVCCLDF